MSIVTQSRAIPFQMSGVGWGKIGGPGAEGGSTILKIEMGVRAGGGDNFPPPSLLF